MYDLKLTGDLELAAELLEYFMDRFDALAITCDPESVSVCRELEECFKVSADRVRGSIEFNRDYERIAGEPRAEEAMENAITILEQLKEHAETLAGQESPEVDYVSDAAKFGRSLESLNRSLEAHKGRQVGASL